jgi:hypothetical protein
MSGEGVEQRACHDRRHDSHDQEHGEQRLPDQARIEPHLHDNQLHESPGIHEGTDPPNIAPIRDQSLPLPASTTTTANITQEKTSATAAPVNDSRPIRVLGYGIQLRQRRALKERCLQCRSYRSEHRWAQHEAGDHFTDHHGLAEETQDEAEDAGASEDDDELQKQG